MSESGHVDACDKDRNEIILVPESPLSSTDPGTESADSLETESDLTIEVSESTMTHFWGRAKKALGDASTRVSATSVAVASQAALLGTSGAAKAAEIGKQTYVAAASAAESSGTTQAIKATAGAVGGKLDEVSGKRLVELLEQKLRIQDSYNDVLATRLAEALERISILEDRVNELTSRSLGSPVLEVEGKE